jgi:hypothetical protein
MAWEVITGIGIHVTVNVEGRLAYHTVSRRVLTVSQERLTEEQKKTNPGQCVSSFSDYVMNASETVLIPRWSAGVSSKCVV